MLHSRLNRFGTCFEEAELLIYVRWIDHSVSQCGLGIASPAHELQDDGKQDVL